MLLLTLAMLAFACEEEAVLPQNEIDTEASLISIDKTFDVTPTTGDYDFDFDIVPIIGLPVVNDSLKNIYDVTLTSGGTELTGILDLDVGNNFSDNFINSGTLTVGGQEFVLVDKNVGIINGFGQFRLTFENEDEDTFFSNLSGSLGRSLSGGFTSNAAGIPTSGSFSAKSQGDPFRIDIDPNQTFIINFPQ